MERRSFLKVLTSVLGLGALASLAYPLLRFLSPLAIHLKTKPIVIPTSQIPPGATRNLVVAETPAIIIHREEAGFVVLSRVCTHLGCLVNFNKARRLLICPCHGGTYTLDGKVIAGPPPLPLPKFPFKIVGNNLEIG
jgi:cytochrome b6-f complex iron-sulfur subunit